MKKVIQLKNELSLLPIASQGGTQPKPSYDFLSVVFLIVLLCKCRSIAVAKEQYPDFHL